MKTSTVILGALLATSSVYAHKDANVKADFVQPSLLSVTPNAPIQDGNVSAAVDNKYPAGARFTIPVNGKNIEVEVEKADLLAPGYVETHLDVDDQGNVLNRAAAISADPTDCYYRGRVVGSTGSMVALDVCDGRLEGLISEGGRSFALEDNDKHARSWWGTIKAKAAALLSPALGPETNAFEAAIARGVAVVDADEELRQQGGIELHGDEVEAAGPVPAAPGLSVKVAKAEDGDDDKDAKDDKDDKEDGKDGLGSVRPVRWVEVILFSDHSRQATYGAGTGKNTLQLFNNMASYYLAAPLKHEVRLVLKGQYVFNSNDPYYPQMLTDGTTQVMGTYGLLNVFLQYVAANRAAFPQYDMALLLSGRGFQSNIRGLANVGAVCSGPTLSS